MFVDRAQSAVALLLERGADAHSVAHSEPGEPALPPLHVAARRADERSAQRLLDAGAAVDQRGGSGETALHVAVRVSSLCFVCFVFALALCTRLFGATVFIAQALLSILKLNLKPKPEP